MRIHSIQFKSNEIFNGSSVQWPPATWKLGVVWMDLRYGTPEPHLPEIYISV
jgi:hypothetical protein